MRRRWFPVVVLAVLVSVALGGLRRDDEQPRADCEDNCAGREKTPKFCSTPNVGNDGQVRCKKICCAADAECGEVVETRDDGKVDRSPYCKNVQKCQWYSGARTYNDTYEPASQCCTDYGVAAKFPMENPARCKDITSAPTVPEANGCGTRNNPVVDTYTYKKKTATFTAACNAHDLCFSKCGARRSDCNEAFEKAMKKACKVFGKGSAGRKGCLEVAADYSDAVYLLGASAFEEAQKASCQCCP